MEVLVDIAVGVVLTGDGLGDLTGAGVGDLVEVGVADEDATKAGSSPA